MAVSEKYFDVFKSNYKGWSEVPEYMKDNLHQRFDTAEHAIETWNFFHKAGKIDLTFADATSQLRGTVREDPSGTPNIQAIFILLGVGALVMFNKS